MNDIFKYIVATALTLCVLACSVEEFGQNAPSGQNYIELVVRPTSFSGYDISTKALTDAELTSLESALYTGYFMLFDGDGNRVFFQRADVVNEGLKLACRYYPENNSSSTTENPVDFNELSGHVACFIANVPYSYASGLTTYGALSSTPLRLYYADHSDTGYIGIPALNLDIDGDNNDDETTTNCFPMFASVGLTSDNLSSNVVTLELERLFAKVNLNVKLNLVNGVGLWNINTATLILNKITCGNLPLYVSPVHSDADANSDWVTENGTSFFLEPAFTIYDQRATGNSNDYNVTMYCPEFFLMPTEKADGEERTEQNKPLYKPEGTNTVNIILEGSFTHPNYQSDAIPFTYTLYLGENEIDSFSLKRNYSYTYKMEITGINEARLETDERIEAEIPITNLASAESANCYIISKIGRYMFPLVKGNTSTSIGTVPVNEDGSIPGSAYELIIDSSGSTENEIDNFKIIENDGTKYLVFDANMKSLSTVTDGNAVLVLKNSVGADLWSWHLWFAPDAFNGNTGYLNKETYNTGAVMLSRNLGASGASSIGFYYKWGKKNPFFNSAYQGSDAETDSDSWGTSKSVTDPCPPEYKVPANSVWNSNLNAAATFAGGYFQYEGSPLVWYPYSGYLDNNDKYIDCTKGDTEKTVTYISGTSATIGLLLSSKINNRNTYIRKVNCTLKESYREGYAWSNSKNIGFKYAYNKSDIYVNSLEVKYGTFSSWAAMDATTLENNRNLITTAVAGWASIVSDPTTIYDTSYETPSTHIGLQVRCVKE